RVVINTDTGQAIPAPNIFEYVFGSFTYYMVANTTSPQKVIVGRKTVKYREGSEEVDFVVNYRGGCQPGCETQLTEFFFRTSGADKAIGDGLGKWPIEFFTTNGRTIDQFYSSNDSESRDLATKALTEFGLCHTTARRLSNTNITNVPNRSS